MPNQHKQVPSAEYLHEYIDKYWNMGKNDLEILELLKKHHIDLNKYGLEIATFRKIRDGLGYRRTRKQGHTVDSIHAAVVKLRAMYPKAGGREMVNLLKFEEKIHVSRPVLMEYFHIHEPMQVRERRRGHFRRKRFWAAGSNDLWAMDQHDKWKYKFGLALHTGIDPFIGVIHWMKVWWNNSNPRLILKYYLNVIEALGFMPLVMQSDPGNENTAVANGHTLIRQYQDPDLRGQLQHRWMREKKNITPEIAWSQLRRRFTPGFENLLDIGLLEGWYDPKILLEALVFRWVFIPWLQAELDAYRNRVNNTRKRRDRNKVLPNGVPMHMFEYPEDYAILDFKIKVDPAAIEMVRELYAPPELQIFELVPPDFHHIISDFYVKIGSPVIDRGSCWDVYLQLLSKFRQLDQAHGVEASADEKWGYTLTQAADNYEGEVELLAGLQELRGGEGVIGQDGSYYMGGVNGGDGLDDIHYNRLNSMIDNIEPDVGGPAGDDEELFAWFSDEESPEDFENADQW
ncbi:unnamed protein product [Mycena citricolor]|uniref:Integrase core domain-containing protein n=1 Tax=Mycena citricolor TaxID=2018698 RepID=A0AAD2JWL5_9AGAR|nr:unnamed protein product [Mycena citricolor]